MTASANTKVPPSGLYVPTVIFYDEDDNLDTANITRHALRMAEGGMAGIVVQGTNGESVHLDAEERKLAISTTRQALDKGGYTHIPIVAGTGSMSMKETLSLTRQAKEAGAEFSLVIAPHYWAAAMTKPVLIAYFTELADKSVLPVILYNFPGVTAGIDLDSDTIITLAQHPNIVGAKFTCGNVGKIHRVAKHTSRETFAPMGGKSDFIIHGLLAGMTGATCGLCNLFPKVHTACFKKYLAGDVDGARELQDILADADSAAGKICGLAGYKLAVRKYFGYGNGVVRSPLPNVTEAGLKASDEIFGQLMKLESEL